MCAGPRHSYRIVPPKSNKVIISLARRAGFVWFITNPEPSLLLGQEELDQARESLPLDPQKMCKPPARMATISAYAPIQYLLGLYIKEHDQYAITQNTWR